MHHSAFINVDMKAFFAAYRIDVLLIKLVNSHNEMAKISQARFKIARQTLAQQRWLLASLFRLMRRLADARFSDDALSAGQLKIARRCHGTTRLMAGKNRDDDEMRPR